MDEYQIHQEFAFLSLVLSFEFGKYFFQSLQITCLRENTNPNNSATEKATVAIIEALLENKINIAITARAINFQLILQINLHMFF